MFSRRKSFTLLVIIGILAFNFSLSSANFQRLDDLALERHGQQAADTVGQWQAMIEESEDFDRHVVTGASIIAEGVQSEREWNALEDLGVDGATDPEVTRRDKES